MYRDALLGRKATKPQAQLQQPAAVPALTAPPVAPQSSSSSSSKRDASSRRQDRDDSWQKVKTRQPVSNWNGYAFVDDNGAVAFNTKHSKFEKLRHIRQQHVILDFNQCASPVSLVSCRLYPEIRRPAPEEPAGDKRPRRAHLPTAVPIKLPTMQYALDAIMQVSRNQQMGGNLFTFTNSDGTPFDKDADMGACASPVRVRVNFESEEARTNAVLDKLRFADRLVREADELSSQVSAKEGTDAKKQQSPQRQKQNQAIRWFFVALLCTTPVHAEAGGLVPLLCNRLASLWNKMRCHHAALFWANESLKIVPEDYHAHLNKCQALLDLGRFGQAIEAANEALAVLEGSCAPIKRILASARVSHSGPSTTGVVTRKSWRLCNDITGLILGFLTNSDRQSAAVVCKHWAGVTRQVVMRNLTEEKPSKVAAYLRRAGSSAVDIGSVGQYIFSSRRDEWIEGSRETFALKAVDECNAANLRWALLSWSRLSSGLLSDEGTSKTILGCCLDRCFSEQRKPEDRARFVELVRVALEYGCNPNTRVTAKQVEWQEEGRKVSKGLLPLEKAMLAGSKEVLSLLVRYGAEPERILKGLGAGKKLSSLELLLAFYPALLEQRELAAKLTADCVAEGWLDGLKMCHQAGIFSKYPSLVDGLIEESLKRLKTLVEPGVSDALWSEPDKLPFTTGALDLLMACRNTRGAGLSPDCEAMAIAKHLDGVLWTTNLRSVLRGDPAREAFSLYSVNNYKVV